MTGKQIKCDLWGELSTLCEEHVVVFRWVKSHNGHLQNEYCDQLAKKAARRKERLLVDTNYENKINKQEGENLWNK
jgi:ribonuclease HI